MEPQEQELRDAVKGFTDSMLDRLAQKESAGFSGWKTWPQRHLRNRLNTKVLRVMRDIPKPDDLVDIANFCMMLKYQEQQEQEDAK